MQTEIYFWYCAHNLIKDFVPVFSYGFCTILFYVFWKVVCPYGQEYTSQKPYEKNIHFHALKSLLTNIISIQQQIDHLPNHSAVLHMPHHTSNSIPSWISKLPHRNKGISRIAPAVEFGSWKWIVDPWILVCILHIVIVSSYNKTVDHQSEDPIHSTESQMGRRIVLPCVLQQGCFTKPQDHLNQKSVAVIR